MSVYVDHHAATPIDARVQEAMARAREDAWANPSSAHAPGRAARRVVETARERLAAAIGASPADVIFTGGGTEACNLGVLGLGGARVLTTSIEHPAVEASVRALGAVVTTVHLLDGEAPALPLHGVDLACIGWVNHETGTILPIEAYARECRAAGARLFVDATAALGKLPIDVTALGATAVAFASSKIGGPPGVGALWIDREADLAPRHLGGGQERGRRAGSPDPVAIAGLGCAATLVLERLAGMPETALRRDRLERHLAPHGVVNGASGPRVATVTNVSVRGWLGPRLTAALDVEGLHASAGAACSSGVEEPSPVIAAMAPGEPWRAEAAIRLSLGPSTSDADVDEAMAILTRVLARKTS